MLAPARHGIRMMKPTADSLWKSTRIALLASLLLLGQQAWAQPDHRGNAQGKQHKFQRPSPDARWDSWNRVRPNTQGGYGRGYEQRQELEGSPLRSDFESAGGASPAGSTGRYGRGR